MSHSNLVSIPFALLLSTSSLYLHQRDQSLQGAGPTPFCAATILPNERTRFQEQVLFAANNQRAAQGLPPFDPSPEINQNLSLFVNNRFGGESLDPLLSHLHGQIPQLRSMNAHHVSAASLAELLAEFLASDFLRPDHNCLAVFPYVEDEKYAAYFISAHRLAAMELPVSRFLRDTLFTRCKECGKGHGLALWKEAGSTLIIQCPHCRQNYDLVASDDQGHWRRSIDFLQGEAPLQADCNLASDEERIINLWRKVVSLCNYTADIDRIGGGDDWKFPLTTYAQRDGDCEDSAILLAQALISSGFSARVALGHYQGGGHAWCVVKLGTNQYILESTLDDARQIRSLPSLEKVAWDYHPEYLFDQESIYFSRHGDWTADYWSTERWREVKHAEEPAATGSMAMH